jgi:hypothetical protein
LNWGATKLVPPQPGSSAGFPVRTADGSSNVAAQLLPLDGLACAGGDGGDA